MVDDGSVGDAAVAVGFLSQISWMFLDLFGRLLLAALLPWLKKDDGTLYYYLMTVIWQG